MIRPSLSVAGLALLLVACGDKTAAPPSEDDQRKARGEVLGGSISDEMIPLDQLTSVAPPLKETPAADDSAAPGAAKPAPDAAAEEPASEPAAAEAPAAAETPAEN